MSFPTRRQFVQAGAICLGTPLLGFAEQPQSQSQSPSTAVPEQGTSATKAADTGVTVSPFLMFEGDAGRAMELYCRVFPNSKVESVEKYGANDDGPEGTIKLATFSLSGQKVMCIDSPMKHGFTFTPATSLFVTCETAQQVDGFFEALSEGGKVMMPLNEYPFSKRFAWVADRFGVSWQFSAV